MSEYYTRRLNILYDSLIDIRQNITDIALHENNNGIDNNYMLSHDQRFMIDLYTTFYNTTLRQIDFLQQRETLYQSPPSNNRGDNLNADCTTKVPW